MKVNPHTRCIQNPKLNDRARNMGVYAKTPKSTKSNLPIIQQLFARCETDKVFKDLLEKSLNLANTNGARKLRPPLYRALRWPSDSHEYVEYLEEFWQSTPVQSPGEAWTSPDNPREQKELHNRICHFYYLIDQDLGGTQGGLQSLPWFSDWLVQYSKLWGSFLDTTDSISEESIQSFYDNAPQYRVEDSLLPDGSPNNPSGWLTFNQFFARRLNDGLRPISSPENNRTVTSPADCTFIETYKIAENNEIPKVTMKHTHQFASIDDLMDGSPHASNFKGGTFVHYFLNSFSYHRFHAPVSGKLVECRTIQGKSYLEVRVGDKGDFDAPDTSQGGYEFNQARGLAVYDTATSQFGDIGKVAVLPVGMAQISSVQMTAVAKSTVLKGDELGHFLFGGSDIIVLLERRANPQVFQNRKYRHFGTPIADCLPEE